MKSFWKIVPWLFVALFAADIIAVMMPKKDGEYHVREFGRLPVLLNGRIQPFDTLARNSLLQIRSTGDVPLEEVPGWKFWHHPKKLKATEWLLEVMTRPADADTRPIFLIHHAELLGELKLQDKGVDKSGLRYYTYSELEPVLNVISEQGRKASDVKAEQQTTFQKQVVKLANALWIYQRLKVTLQPGDAENFAGEIAEFQKNLPAAQAAAQSGDANKGANKEAVTRIARPLEDFQQMANYGYAMIVPPLQPQAGAHAWQNAGTSLLELARGQELHPAVAAYVAMASAYGQKKPAEFNRALEQYQSWLQPRFPKEVSKGRAEFYYNDVKAFLHSIIIYIFAFVLACVALLTISVVPNFSESLRRSAFYLVIIAGLFHTFGLVFRMVLEGRPPVTNLYSSAIFIGWGTMVLGLIIERMYRVAIGSIVAALAGFVTLLIAQNLALGGDTMEMMRAVLDTNFWLATHVVVITLGYAATFFAGLLAILYIVLGLFTPLLGRKLNPAAASANAPTSAAPARAGVTMGHALSKMVYGIVCFATLFSFLGTVLGGIWADQSWGRFWGWDPKENGALLIVLWNAIILHARWGGLVRERGIMNLAIFGNIVTSFSWFGVNMLGIGLHSYGFMDAAFVWLMMFIVSQALLIGDGLLPKSCWQGYEGPDKSFGALARWIALGFNGVVMLVGYLTGYNSVWCLLTLGVFFAFVAAVSLVKPGAAPSAPVPLPPASGRKSRPAATPATT